MPSCLIFSGEEEYVKEQALQQLRRAYLPEGLEALNESLLSENATEQSILDAAEQMPFMAEKRLVLIKDSSLVFPSTRGKESVSDGLLKLVQKAPDSLCLLFYGHGNADKRKKLTMAIQKANGLVEFNPLTPRDLGVWIRREVGRFGKAMDPAAIERMIFMVGNSLSDIKNELDKLISYVGDRQQIVSDDLERIAVRSLEANVYRMIDDLLDGQTPQALQRLEELLLQGQSRIAILAAITRNLRQLYYTRLMLDQRAPRSRIEQELELRSFVARMVIDRAANYDSKWLKGAVLLCDETDYAIKSGQIREEQALDIVFLRLTQK